MVEIHDADRRDLLVRLDDLERRINSVHREITRSLDTEQPPGPRQLHAWRDTLEGWSD